MNGFCNLGRFSRWKFRPTAQVSGKVAFEFECYKCEIFHSGDYTHCSNLVEDLSWPEVCQFEHELIVRVGDFYTFYGKYLCNCT